MAAEDLQRCAWLPCGRLVERPATGRPGRYCGSNCRQSDYRERVRQAGAERDRAAQLARAEAEAAVVAYASARPTPVPGWPTCCTGSARRPASSKGWRSATGTRSTRPPGLPAREDQRPEIRR